MIFVAIVLSFLPAFLYATIIYWIDRYEREPRILLWGVFIWGAIVAAGAAYILNTAIGIGLYELTNSIAFSTNIQNSIIAPLTEESLKAFAVLIIFVIRREEFDSIIDGIAYAGIAALGFAATENVLYLYERGYVPNGLEGMWIQFVVRVIFGAWNHSFYTAFIGIGFAISRLSKNINIRRTMPLIGFSLAVLVHILHNSLHSTAEEFGVLVLVIIVDWLGWIVMGAVIVWALRRERNMMVAELKEEVEASVISEDLYDSITRAWFGEISNLRRNVSGSKATTRQLYKMCSELAHKKHQWETLGETRANSKEMIEDLRLKIGKLAQEVSKDSK